MARSDTKVVGSAGEHFVCSALAQLGWAASLTREGVARTDVLAVNPTAEGRPMIEVQVKTIRPTPKPLWPMGGSWMERAASGREWYVFVLLGHKVIERPRCFVVPRDHATCAAWVGHMVWKTDPSAAPGKRNAPVVQSRAGLDLFGPYEERWDLLQHDALEIDVLLPVWIRDSMEKPEIEFPDWHPWHSGDTPLWRQATADAA